MIELGYHVSVLRMKENVGSILKEACRKRYTF